MLLSVAGRIFFQTHLFPLLRLHGRAEEIFLLMRAKSGEDVGILTNATRREVDGAGCTECIMMEVRERRKFEDELLRARRTAEAAHAALTVRQQELEDANARLEAQATELERQQAQLQEQAVELEAAGEEMQVINEDLLRRSEELERARDEADEANRAKSNFLAVMSHELRTPLNAIAGYVQLLEMGIHGPITDPQREALDRILRSQRHLLRLINDVLNLARIEAGRVEYHLEDLALADVVATVVPMLEPQMGAKRLAFTSDVSRALVVRADRDKTQQILINLLTNAVKFTGPDGSIAIDAATRADRPDRIFLRVTDTGSGIAPEQLERVFEPFVQVDTSHTRRNEGSGLGLAISRDLARGMGGDLRARSELGRGSVFTLELEGARPS
jgi:signal transduction histidine kinase